MKLEPVRVTGVVETKERVATTDEHAFAGEQQSVVVMRNQLHPQDNGQDYIASPLLPGPMRNYITVQVPPGEQIPAPGIATAEGTIEWDANDSQTLNLVTAHRLTSLNEQLTGEWKQVLRNDHSGYASVEMSEKLRATLSDATAENPAPYSLALESEVEAAHDSIDRSTLFDSAFSYGGRYVSGHGYAATIGVLVVTDPMRRYLAQVNHRICLIPLVERIAAS